MISYINRCLERVDMNYLFGALTLSMKQNNSGFSLIKQGSPLHSILVENETTFEKVNVLEDLESNLELLLPIIEECCDVFGLEHDHSTKLTLSERHFYKVILHHLLGGYDLFKSILLTEENSLMDIQSFLIQTISSSHDNNGHRPCYYKLPAIDAVSEDNNKMEEMLLPLKNKGNVYVVVMDCEFDWNDESILLHVKNALNHCPSDTVTLVLDVGSNNVTVNQEKNQLKSLHELQYVIDNHGLVITNVLSNVTSIGDYFLIGTAIDSPHELKIKLLRRDLA